MMLNKVEIFKGACPAELEGAINAYCLQYRLEPLSISMTFGNGEYIAAVVVREY